MPIPTPAACTHTTGLRAEFRACQRFMRQPSDFFEGIRAALVDKDKAPRWAPQSLTDVADESVAEYLAPLQHHRGEPHVLTSFCLHRYFAPLSERELEL